jgi:predicted phosphodiesterase
MTIRHASIIALAVVALAGAAQGAYTRFAVIGDYGVDNANQAAVATRVNALNPDFITTVGDNTYFTNTDVSNWDRTQAKYYRNYIKLPANSAFSGQGSTTNKFFPVMGNHDWDVGNTAASYTSYFDLPGNERYYTITQGDVQIFMLSSDPREPDGVTVGSTQYNWFTQQIAQSTARWQIVQFHHPFQTSVSGHGPSNYMNWGFENLGVDAVLSGHNHNMERLEYGGIPWFVTGAGGQGLYTVSSVSPNSVFRNDSSFGFMQVEATENYLKFQFMNTAGTVLDTRVVPAPAGAALLAAPGAMLLRRRRGN